MAETLVDARGLDCPQPVIMTRNAITEPGAEAVTVQVDDAVQAENVATMARNQGWDVKISGDDVGYLTLTLNRSSTAAKTGSTDAAAGGTCGLPTKVVIQLASDKFGSGDDDLGAILMRSFIKTVREVVPRPSSLVLVNSGVKLSTAGSEVIEDLKLLADAGIDIINCGTCLDFFGLKDKLLVGRISNMYDIATELLSADRVIKP